MTLKFKTTKQMKDYLTDKIESEKRHREQYLENVPGLIAKRWIEIARDELDRALQCDRRIITLFQALAHIE